LDYFGSQTLRRLQESEDQARGLYEEIYANYGESVELRNDAQSSYWAGEIGERGLAVANENYLLSYRDMLNAGYGYLAAMSTHESERTRRVQGMLRQADFPTRSRQLAFAAQRAEALRRARPAGNNRRRGSDSSHDGAHDGRQHGDSRRRSSRRSGPARR
jgi:hypothetical protein